MKFDSIKRSVSTNRNPRDLGAAPGMGRVSRMPSIQLVSPTRKRGERPNEGYDGGRRQRSSLVRWFFISLALVVICLGVTAGLWIHFYQGQAAGAVAAALRASEKKSALTQFKAPTGEDAIELVKRSLIVRESHEITSFFMLGKSSPQVIAAYLANLEQTDGKISNLESLGNLSTPQLQIAGVAVTFDGPEGVKKRQALLTPTSEGKWKIDFDAFSRTSRPSWEQFLGHEVDMAEVRVVAAEGNYYQGVFRDEREWLCYRLLSPDRPESMQGYCKIGSRQALAMQRLFSNGSKDRRMTLEIRRVEYSQPHQFLISRVYAEDWIRPEQPYDEAL